MQTIKVKTEVLENLKALQVARDEKNKATKTEKEIKIRLSAQIPEIEFDALALMFNGQVVASQTESFRSGVDLEKLQREFPKAFEACQRETKVLSLKITI